VAAIHEEGLLGVQATIQGLPLLLPDASTLPDAQVYLREWLTERNATIPGIFVALFPGPEEMEDGTSGADDFGYPCQVSIVTAANQELPLPANDYRLRWRQQIRDVFRFQRPAAVEAAVSVPLRYCRWQPGNILNPDAYRNHNLFVSEMVVWVLTREVR
jgi:hypothetical protein